MWVVRGCGGDGSGRWCWCENGVGGERMEGLKGREGGGEVRCWCGGVDDGGDGGSSSSSSSSGGVV